MTRKTHHIVPAPRGGWNVKKGGAQRASNHFDIKTDAIDVGRAISRNQHTEFVIHNRNGRIAHSDSHGFNSHSPHG
jgi:hypothetical protein